MSDHIPYNREMDLRLNPWKRNYPSFMRGLAEERQRAEATRRREDAEQQRAWDAMAEANGPDYDPDGFSTY